MTSLFDLVGRLENALSYHRDRHEVLSGNIANIDTPGFRPKELVARQGVEDTSFISILRTDGSHVDAPRSEYQGGDVVEEAGPEVGADGNSVSLERQMAKLEANRLLYKTTSEVVARRLAMLRYSAGDGNG